MLLLTLPGTAFIYQGDEIGLADGPGHDPPYDRAGRDGARHPMQWEPDERGGFTTGEPWLVPVDPGERSVAAQTGDQRSLLSLYRELIALRPRLGRGIRMLDSAPGTLVYERGDDHVVALNLTSEERPAPAHGEVLLASGEARDTLAPHSGIVARRRN
jgi:alpha-glucosidase